MSKEVTIKVESEYASIERKLTMKVDEFPSNEKIIEQCQRILDELNNAESVAREIMSEIDD